MSLELVSVAKGHSSQRGFIAAPLSQEFAQKRGKLPDSANFKNLEFRIFEKPTKVDLENKVPRSAIGYVQKRCNPVERG